jgi:hypothetical protein
MTFLIVCKDCKREFRSYETDDNFGTESCHDCFEVHMEEYEERRQRRIAEANEY